MFGKISRECDQRCKMTRKSDWRWIVHQGSLNDLWNRIFFYYLLLNTKKENSYKVAMIYRCWISLHYMWTIASNNRSFGCPILYRNIIHNAIFYEHLSHAWYKAHSLIGKLCLAIISNNGNTCLTVNSSSHNNYVTFKVIWRPYVGECSVNMRFLISLFVIICSDLTVAITSAADDVYAPQMG